LKVEKQHLFEIEIIVFTFSFMQFKTKM